MFFLFVAVAGGGEVKSMGISFALMPTRIMVHALAPPFRVREPFCEDIGGHVFALGINKSDNTGVADFLKPRDRDLVRPSKVTHGRISTRAHTRNECCVVVVHGEHSIADVHSVGRVVRAPRGTSVPLRNWARAPRDTNLPPPPFADQA